MLKSKIKLGRGRGGEQCQIGWSRVTLQLNESEWSKEVRHAGSWGRGSPRRSAGVEVCLVGSRADGRPGEVVGIWVMFSFVGRSFVISLQMREPIEGFEQGVDVFKFNCFLNLSRFFFCPLNQTYVRPLILSTMFVCLFLLGSAAWIISLDLFSHIFPSDVLIFYLSSLLGF